MLFMKRIVVLRSLIFKRYCSKSATKLRKIDRLLVANRGEIAVRIMNTAKQCGIETVAVFSDVDQHSMHVKMADHAYCIGPAPSLQSYLGMDKIIDTAVKSGCQAIHPGYGFLSENATFADKCSESNLIFVGPPSQAIRDMGAKNVSKRIMSEAGVPVIVGYHGSDQSDEKLKDEAKKIGFPVMLKAVYGGGGKGMRIAWNESEFNEKLESARSEAKKAFGNDEMIVEKFVERPRHVEVQVFGDRHGNYVYLWERDCSIQRRHQKIIEEAPAPGIDVETRQRLGESAVRAARAVSYVGAGTVEFIMNPQKEFFFMEMNTRLQVEHPVTEAITGTDLVQWQLRVAEGDLLPLSQAEIPLNGHSIEARIYAEDTNMGFIPIAGKLKYLSFPESARVDRGIEQGDEVSVHYDPMIAKVIAWSDDRKKAISKLEKALRDTHIGGLSTNVAFVRSVLSHPNFIEGSVYTDFIADHEKDLFKAREPARIDICEAVASQILFAQNQSHRNDCFQMNDYFRLNHSAKLNVKVDEKATYCVNFLGNGAIQVNAQDKIVDFVLDEVERKDDEIKFSLILDGEKWRRKAILVDEKILVFGEEHHEYPLTSGHEEGLEESDETADACAPMPGVIEKILVNPDEAVKAGQPLVVMVAMKMEYVIRAPCDAIVQAVQCSLGSNVAKGAHLIKFSHM